MLKYIQLSRAWYGPANLKIYRNKGIQDIVTFGDFFRDGSCRAEMNLEWHLLGSPSSQKPYPKLASFSDSWRFLAKNQKLLRALARVNGQHITPTEFCTMLDKCGYKDATPLTQEPS